MLRCLQPDACSSRVLARAAGGGRRAVALLCGNACRPHASSAGKLVSMSRALRGAMRHRERVDARLLGRPLLPSVWWLPSVLCSCAAGRLLRPLRLWRPGLTSEPLTARAARLLSLLRGYAHTHAHAHTLPDSLGLAACTSPLPHCQCCCSASASTGDAASRIGARRAWVELRWPSETRFVDAGDHDRRKPRCMCICIWKKKSRSSVDAHVRARRRASVVELVQAADQR